MSDQTSGNDKKSRDDIPDELLIVLRKPVKLGTDTIAELNLREPTNGEVERFFKDTDKSGPLVAMNNFIATISGVNKAAIDMIGARDGIKAREYLTNFL